MKPTQEQSITLARAYRAGYEAGRESTKVDSIHTCHADCQNPICIAVRQAVAEEREACAKLCDELADDAAKEQDFHAIFACESCASTIRERGKNERH